MNYPDDSSLPFFTYGAFRPGEIGFLRLKPYVKHIQASCYTEGRLFIRDGFILLDPTTGFKVEGSILDFTSNVAGKAYFSIVELEPEKQYSWKVIKVEVPDEKIIDANALVGLNLSHGCVLPDRSLTGKDDPLFKEVFYIVKATLSKHSKKQSATEPNPDFTNFLYLQMAYMLLWTSIERYATLRYSYSDNIMQKILSIAEDPIFAENLKLAVKREDKLYPTNDPSKAGAVKLNKDNPKGSLKYYYQVRCNITHRGKAAFEDFERLKKSLEELTNIYQKTLKNAFQESRF